MVARAGQVDWFFEPDSFRPMARHQAGVLFHIVNDHLGTPKEMFSEGGALAWSIDHDTWGTVRRVGSRRVERGEYWVESVAYELSEAQPEAATLLCPIRFQGQWEDVETGLYCNRFRYYEPLAGQYASPDPIGLSGGYNSDRYVLNAAIWTDPLGLAPFGSGKGQHIALVTVCDNDGKIKFQDTFQSGNMTAEEKALGFPRSTLATHTEYRAVNQVPLDPGDVMIIEGQYPPCTSCKGKMNKAAGAAQATIEYVWREGAELMRWGGGLLR